MNISINLIMTNCSTSWNPLANVKEKRDMDAVVVFNKCRTFFAWRITKVEFWNKNKTNTTVITKQQIFIKNHSSFLLTSLITLFKIISQWGLPHYVRFINRNNGIDTPIEIMKGNETACEVRYMYFFRNFFLLCYFRFYIIESLLFEQLILFN